LLFAALVFSGGAALLCVALAISGFAFSTVVLGFFIAFSSAARAISAASCALAFSAIPPPSPLQLLPLLAHKQRSPYTPPQS